jgi:mannosyltransferase OCH1-like enzyme
MWGIPKVLHFVWGLWDAGPLPPWARDQVNAWAAHCPDFAIKIWDKHACETLLRSEKYARWRPFYDRAPRRVMCADLLRYMILDHEGGWYLDLDCVPRDKHALAALCDAQHPFVGLTESNHSAAQARAVGKREPVRQGRPELRRRIANFAVGSVPNHVVWRGLFDRIAQRWGDWVRANPSGVLARDYDVLYITGPDAFTESVASVEAAGIPMHVLSHAQSLRTVGHVSRGSWKTH